MTEMVTAVTGAGVIFGALAVAYVAFKGGKLLIGVLRG